MEFKAVPLALIDERIFIIKTVRLPSISSRQKKQMSSRQKKAERNLGYVIMRTFKTLGKTHKMGSLSDMEDCVAQFN